MTGVKRLEAEGELFVDALVGVLGSYTVAGSRVGGSEGICGGAVTDEGGPYAGERGLTRRGLAAGERLEGRLELMARAGEELRREGDCGCGAAPLMVLLALVAVVLAERGAAGVVKLNLRCDKVGLGG